MESTPSLVNWDEENNVKRPGMNYLSSMQAIALGSNSVLYFQWRKSRGSSEKFHGAVVDHDASEKNRVFQEVAWIGKDLEKLSSQILSTCNRAKVAIIMDWENWWALSDAQAISRKFDYTEELLKYYRVFWEKGIEVDIISMDRELSDYQLVVAPTLYLHKKEYIHKVEAYVEAGGIYVTTYWSGVVNETDLCFIGERPHERLLGLSVDEIDVGISGRTAQKVSEKMALIGRKHQVICITHLAQIAAMADHHFMIEKNVSDGQTKTSIRELKAEESTDELARILGGAKITDTVRQNAKEMQELAAQIKK